MKQPYQLASDPVLYAAVALLAAVVTAFPAAMGQSWVLPVLQTLLLTAFIVIAARRGMVHAATVITAVWLAVQFLTVVVVTWLANEQVEQVIPNGFAARAAFLEWFYTGVNLPHSWRGELAARLVELASVTVGSLLTGGLAGAWALTRAVNSAGFEAGSLLLSQGNWGLLPAGILPWLLLSIGGYAGLTALLAQPLWTGVWSPQHYVRQHGRFLLICLALVASGILLEFVAANGWRGLWQ